VSRPPGSVVGTIYERTLELRRDNEIVPFTIRLENMGLWRKGHRNELEADLIIDGLGSKLDFQDTSLFKVPIVQVDALSCILLSVNALREILKRYEDDIRWFDEDGREGGGFGWFGLPRNHDFAQYGIDFDGEMEALIEQRTTERITELVAQRSAARAKRKRSKIGVDLV
jgi:hypothetical protein